MNVLGVAHLTLAISALITGGVVVLLPKGGPGHRLVGFFYAVSMIGVNGSALLIYNLTGDFGPFHGLALFSLGTVLVGVSFVLIRPKGRPWIRSHAFWMSWSYVGLVAAAASEGLTRIPESPFWWMVGLASALVVFVGGWIIAVRVPRILAERFPGQL